MNEQTVTVTVPFAIRKRGGRKLVVTPDGVAVTPAPRARVDSALLKALARAGDNPDAVRRVGLHYATEQCADLLHHGVQRSEREGLLQIVDRAGLEARRDVAKIDMAVDFGRIGL